MAGSQVDITGSATGHNVPRPSAHFNEMAMLDVYKGAGTLKHKFGILVDADATIKGSSIYTNLDALYAGTKDMDVQTQKDVKRFANVILKHDDLRAGASAMLKDEGENVTSIMKDMLTGDGKLNMDQFETMMENPGYRKTVANMFHRVGTSELGAEYTARFTKDAMDAVNNPDDAKKRDKFLKTAKDGGVDTSGLQQQEMMKMAKEFWKDPNKTIVGMLDKMDLSPDLKNSLAGIMSTLAGFMKEVVGHYAFGDGQQPGIIQIAQNAYDSSQKSGAQLRAQYGSVDLPPETPLPPRAPGMMGPG